MDSSSYKEAVTRRGFKYSYFASASRSSKPTILLLHGFPMTSRDWRKQVPVLQEAGYGIIAPDCLGYGGTDKPTDPTKYKYSEMAADLVDILDAEKADKVVVIGYDWGSTMTSRFANYYPERCLALAFLVLGYTLPYTDFNYPAAVAATEKMLGYAPFGYWAFFSEEGASETIREHWDSFYSILHPPDAAVWKTDFAPPGALKAWLLADKKGPLPAYLTEADKENAKAALLSGSGLAGALSWYKVMTTNIANEDNKNIPPERHTVQQPVFFAAATKDCICIAATYKAIVQKLCPNNTIRAYEKDHWLSLDNPEELNKDLLEWLGGAALAKL
ncbi:Alpha/Beta hydrolase protein [Amylocystis lapponica]|nr:Alpha/Beta hydrolase protein [Amylocystis lapponica]